MTIVSMSYAIEATHGRLVFKVAPLRYLAQQPSRGAKASIYVLEAFFWDACTSICSSSADVSSATQNHVPSFPMQLLAPPAVHFCFDKLPKSSMPVRKCVCLYLKISMHI